MANGGGIEGAGEGLEGRDVDDGMVMEMRGKLEAVGDVGEGGGDAVRAIKFGA